MNKDTPAGITRLLAVNRAFITILAINENVYHLSPTPVSISDSLSCVLLITKYSCLYAIGRETKDKTEQLMFAC